MILWVFLAIAILLLLGARLFVVVGVTTMLCFILVLGEGMSTSGLVRIANMVEGLTTKNVFLSLPFFVAAGTVMTRGGMARRLIAVARACVGFMPGGLAIASVLACIIFAAISGSSPVTLVAVGSIMFPALVQSKYPEQASMGLLMTAGSLGCMVPPSIAMIIYSISVNGSASVTPSDLFLAGLVPAVAITGILAVYAFVVGRSVAGARPPFSLGELKTALFEGAFALALPVIVVGGIYSGQFTPTEAGAVALMYSVVVTTQVHREMTLSGLADAFAETATLIGSLVLIVVLSFGLNDFLAEVEAAERLGEWLSSAHLSPVSFFLVVNVALIVVGALMDSISATLVFAPLLAPIALKVYGIDPIHFGIVFVVNMEIGYLAPPVATNLFVGAAIFQRPFGAVARAVLPTLSLVCVALVVIMYVPTLSKALVNLKAGKPAYQAFPWDGPPHASPDTNTAESATEPSSESSDSRSDGPSGSGANAPSGPGRVLTMEEMMKKAAAARADAGPAATPGGAPHVMTMDEMMAVARARAADAGSASGSGAAPDAGAP